MEQIYTEPDIYRIPASDRGGGLFGTYLICSKGEALVVDPRLKSPEGRKQLQDALSEHGLLPDRVRIFFTHLHSGHAGAVCEWMPAGGRLLMHELDYRPAGKNGPWAYQNRRYIREGYPKEALSEVWHGNEACRAPEEGVDFVTEGSRILVGDWCFHCMHTPGHTPGHTCLFLPEKGILFSGDMLLFDGIPYVGIWKGEPHALEDSLYSLERLASEPVALVLPTHGRMGTAAAARIEEITRHYYLRLLELYRLIYDYPGSTAYELAAHFSRYGEKWPGISPKKRWIAMGETLSHLVYLRARSYVEHRRSACGMTNYPGRRRLTDS